MFRGAIFSPQDRHHYRLLISDFLSKSQDSSISIDLNVVVDHIEDCLRLREQLHLFDISNSRKLPLDTFLLKTLLGPNLGISNLAFSLRSIVSWGQVELMIEVLERADFDQTEAMEELMTECLMEQKVEFVVALVEHGFAMKKYLTVAMLRSLYQKVVRKHSRNC